MIRATSSGGYGAYHARNAAPEVDIEPVSFLAEALQQRIAEQERTSTRFLAWAKKVPEPKSGTLDFDRFPFQRELYERGAEDPEMVVKKATQVGVSAYLVRWTMFHADRGLTALYIFPRLKQLYDFSDARIKTIILRSEYLRERVGGSHVQNKGYKQVGTGEIYYRGSESVDDLQSVDADVLALDEYDQLVQANIPDAERRISGSQVGLIRRVGVPSIPQYGIARLYDESDRRRWHVKCSACGDFQPITFRDNVVHGSGDHTNDAAPHIGCRSCVKPLDVAKGEWVAEFPDRGVRGYHVPRLVVPGVDLPRIVQASKAREPYKVTAFHNKDLGEEFTPEGGRLSLETIAAAQREFPQAPADGGYSGYNTVTMGVDVASVRRLNVRISEHIEDNVKKALFIGEVDNFDVLANMMDRFRVKMAAIDHLPDGRLSRGFVERFAGRAYVVGYSQNQRDVISVDEQQRRAMVRRVEAMDATMEMIRQQRNLLPINLPEGYVSHMQANVRVVDADDLGKVVVAYRSTSDDDYMHAEVYDLIATELWYIRQAVDESQREVFQPLDNLMEFQRSDLSDHEATEYRPGPDEPGEWDY